MQDLKQQIISLPPDELWDLHQEIQVILIAKMHAQLLEIGKRIDIISQSRGTIEANGRQDDIDKVLEKNQAAPKYANPDNRGETWVGRGKRPRWLRHALESGRKLEEFRINGEAALGAKGSPARATIRVVA